MSRYWLYTTTYCHFISLYDILYLPCWWPQVVVAVVIWVIYHKVMAPYRGFAITTTSVGPGCPWRWRCSQCQPWPVARLNILPATSISLWKSLKPVFVQYFFNMVFIDNCSHSSIILYLFVQYGFNLHADCQNITVCHIHPGFPGPFSSAFSFWLPGCQTALPYG